MSTLYSLDARAAMTAESTGAVPIWLLTFTHPELADPLRLSTDRTTRLSIDPYVLGTISRGQPYLWIPISLVRPSDGEQIKPEMRLSIEAIDREIFKVIRVRAKASCTIELVYSFSVNLVEETHEFFETESAPYDETQVSLVLSQEAFYGEDWPRGRMTPTWFPGLHR